MRDYHEESVTFEFLRLRFRFRAVDLVRFPQSQSANLLRGAFGNALRRLACLPECREEGEGRHVPACRFARVFAPGGVPGEGPSGFADLPRPFVFRATALDGKTVAPGEPFHFDVHLFDLEPASVTFFVQSFLQVAQKGLGGGRAELVRVEALQLDESPAPPLYDGTSGYRSERQLEPIVLEWGQLIRPSSRVVVRFVTPTELKGDHSMAAVPEFRYLFRRLRDRLSTLRALYGGGPLPIDFCASGERADRITRGHSNLEWISAKRRSSRTGQVHPLGGFTGEVEYHGELGEFLPYLEVGRWIGVGRQTVWGKGEIHIFHS